MRQKKSKLKEKNALIFYKTRSKKVLKKTVFVNELFLKNLICKETTQKENSILLFFAKLNPKVKTKRTALKAKTIDMFKGGFG